MKKTALRAEIIFIGIDDQQLHFITERNNLTGDYCYTFQNWKDCYTSDKRNVKKIINGIKETAKMIIFEKIDNNHAGTF